MAGWTKAEFDNAYEFNVERYLGGRTDRRQGVKLHYHEWMVRPILTERWRNIIRVLTPAVQVSGFVLVVGAGFGWGVSALRGLTGCAAIGTDISSYIQAEKGNDDSAEIRAEISRVGLDPTGGRGLEILNAIGVSGLRAKEVVLDEDLADDGSRRRVRSVLGDTPTLIVIEDLVDDRTMDAEIVALAGLLDTWTAQKMWLYTPTASRSAEQLTRLTGHRCVEFRTYEVVG